jgi:FlaA1/EpsC-like NDP-sugar epimerase
MEDKQKASYWFLLVADAVGVVMAYMIAYYLRFVSPVFSVVQLYYLPLSEYLKQLIYLIPVYLLIYDLLRVFAPKKWKDNIRELIRLLLTNVLSIICFLTILYIMKEHNISRIFLLIFVIINVVFGLSIRVFVSHFQKRKS